MQLGYFSPFENLDPRRLNRPTGFSESELTEIKTFKGASDTGTDSHTDRTDLYCVTVDNQSTSDFDDAVSFEDEEDSIIIGIHISDVSAYIASDAVLDKTAIRRASSIYTPDLHLPMLPKSASQNLLSLREGEERLCMSFYIRASKGSFKITERTLALERIKVNEKAYLRAGRSDAL